ncbi:MAG: flippase-like domain-containing protein [Verrucomicrobia bacterium]|nr:flippase-like domain-containing protein [Verrucomicrobiota bacterium]
MKRVALLILQLLVTATVLYFVFRNPVQRAEMWQALQQADLRWLLLGTAVGSLTYLAGSVRFGLLLRAQGIVLPWPRVFGIVFVGIFFNLFGLGAVGGDVVKIFYVVREAQSKKAAAGFTVLMDRIVGLIVLVGIAAVFVVLRYSWLTSTPATQALMATFVLILGGSSGIVFVAAFLAMTGLSQRLPERLPLRARILELVTVFEECGRNWRTLVAAVVLSVIAHGAMFFTFFASARALRVESISYWDISAIMPIVNAIIAIPISVSGIGVREGLFKTLLGDLCHLPASVTVPIAMIGFLIGVFYCLIGAVVYLSFKRTAAPTLQPEAEAEQAG